MKIQRKKILKTISVVSVLFMFASCSSLPEGEKKLQEMVDKDQEQIKTVPDKKETYKGRPILIKVSAYPQMISGGDVFAGGDMILTIGREDISIEELLK